MTRRRPGPDPFTAVVTRLDQADRGIATGFPSLDRALGGGLRAEDLVVLAGDIGSGKSALALAIAVRAARAGTAVAFLSGEMTEPRVLERALAMEGRVAVDDLRGGSLDDATRAEVGAAAIRLRDLPLRLSPLYGQSFDEVTAALDALPRPQVLIVDSLQLVGPPRAVSQTEERVALAARTLKGLALERGVTVLVTAHLPGLRPDRPDPRPTLDDLGGRGAVKQHADVVLGLFREEMYRPGEGVEGATELLVAKNRNGPTGFVDLYYYKRWLRFEDMLDPES
jgi:replicative DNA helicase